MNETGTKMVEAADAVVAETVHAAGKANRIAPRAPSQPIERTVRSIDTAVTGLTMRLTACDGDSLVRISPWSVDWPLVGEVDRIDNGTIQPPRLAILDTEVIPGLFDASKTMLAAAAAAAAAVAHDRERGAS
ncbi:hypothetical protein AB0B28_06515 [Glycomyces sp. NPDC046736]|uniref:hypothetical protein n=1 Tax=Glycomyces sp. NPDC046736 TaxID=3155615 RepID=UPI0033D3A271